MEGPKAGLKGRGRPTVVDKRSSFNEVFGGDGGEARGDVET
jgi:hypothetical protein